MKWAIHAGLVALSLLISASLAAYFALLSGHSVPTLAALGVFAVIGISSCFSLYNHIRWAKKRGRFWRKYGQRANRSANRFIIERMLELRRPLQGMVGIHDLYETTNSPKEESGYLEIAHFCTKHLIRQLERTQFYCELELNTAKVERNSFVLNDCLKTAVSKATEQARINNVAIKVEIDSSTPKFVFGCERYLSKVLIELISNSIRYSSSRSVVVVHANLDSEDSRRIRFTVTDSGMGIEPKRLDEIRNFDLTRKKMHVPWENSSAGIGISLIKSIVQRLNGFITYDSKVGQGTTVCFGFPTGELHEAEAPRVKSHSLASDLKVLVVDDEQVTRQVLIAFFDRLNVTADYAETGEAAVTKAQTQAYDFIVMDLIMPGMGGYAASEKILSQCPHPVKPKIIVVSSNCRPEDYDRAATTGISKFLEKPVRFEQLKSTLIELSLDSTNRDPAQDLAPLVNKAALAVKKEKFHREGGYYVDFNALYNSQNENLSQCQTILYHSSRNLSASLEALAVAMKYEDYDRAERALEDAQSTLKSVFCLHGFETITDLKSKLKGRAPLEQIEVSFDNVCEFIENFCDEIDHLLPDQISTPNEDAA